MIASELLQSELISHHKSLIWLPRGPMRHHHLHNILDYLTLGLVSCESEGCAERALSITT